MKRRDHKAKADEELHFIEQALAVGQIGLLRSPVGPDQPIWLTPEGRRILGLEDGEVLRNIDLLELVHAGDRDLFLEAAVDVRTHGTRRETTMRVTRLGGPERRITLSLAGAPGTESGPYVLVGTLRDVTDEPRAGGAIGTAGEVALARELAHAIGGKELIVEYQPVRSLAEDRFIGAEALVRWEHPSRGRLEPDAFVDIAERSGLIVPLGTRVLETAFGELGRWLEQGVAADFWMAVNVSGAQLRTNALASALDRLDGSKASSLVFEVTESLLIEGSTELEALQSLRERGVRIAIDDFGTRYSALSYLTRLPVDALKIDESFVRDLDTASGRAVVAAITALARELGLHTIAEGVETSEQFHTVRRLGCDAAQGFSIAPPLSGEECLELLRSGR